MVNLTESLLTAQTEHRTSVSVVRLAGQIDILSAPGMRESLDAAVAAMDGAGALVADLSDVSFMGSVGIAELIRARQRAEADGRRFYVVAPPFVRRILELTGLTDTLALLPSADDVPV